MQAFAASPPSEFLFHALKEFPKEMIALDDLLGQQDGRFPEAVQDALTEKIERPTFGACRELLKVACENLTKKRFVPELPEFVKKH